MRCTHHFPVGQHLLQRLLDTAEAKPVGVVVQHVRGRVRKVHTLSTQPKKARARRGWAYNSEQQHGLPPMARHGVLTSKPSSLLTTTVTPENTRVHDVVEDSDRCPPCSMHHLNTRQHANPHEHTTRGKKRDPCPHEKHPPPARGFHVHFLFRCAGVAQENQNAFEKGPPLCKSQTHQLVCHHFDDDFHDLDKFLEKCCSYELEDARGRLVSPKLNS